MSEKLEIHRYNYMYVKVDYDLITLTVIIDIVG